MTPTTPGGRIVQCVDNDPSCDHDFTPGVCGFEITACLNNADPSLPNCVASGDIERARVRGGADGGRDLQDELDLLLPTSENVCTEPVEVSVPITAQGGPAPGERHFSLNPDGSFFAINGLTLGTFTGSIDLKANAVDASTGLATVDVVGASDFIYANIPLGGLVLCLHPVTPAPNAGVMVCGKRTRGGRAMHVNVGGVGTSDRDGLLLICRSEVNYSISLTVDSDVGVVGEDGFTQADCDAVGGTVEPPPSNVCNSGFMAGQLDELSNKLGEMILAPIPGLNGFPVEITQERALPCGDEPAGGMSVAIALTTTYSAGRILNANNALGADPIEFGLPTTMPPGDNPGEPFDCSDFTREDGPGVLVFSAPQLGLPILGDGVTQFRFSDE